MAILIIAAFQQLHPMQLHANHPSVPLLGGGKPYYRIISIQTEHIPK
jgi:hypothetical protein